MPRKKSPPSHCRQCSSPTARPGYTYCSNRCQWEFQNNQYLTDWRRGKISGLERMGLVSKTIKDYLRKKFNNRCCLCGWHEVNPITKKVPLVADHIDGNWRNNTESNLRLLCPNCDSLSPTYAALNKGKGRPNRPTSKRALEARRIG